MEKLTSELVEDIAEELRTTRYKKNGKMAFEFVYDKYKSYFDNIGGYGLFLRLMEICAVFFASQGEKTKTIRENTQYQYV